MGNYCKHYTTIRGMFSDATVITDITIPPSCGDGFCCLQFKQ